MGQVVLLVLLLVVVVVVVERELHKYCGCPVRSPGVQKGLCCDERHSLLQYESTGLSCGFLRARTHARTNE